MTDTLAPIVVIQRPQSGDIVPRKAAVPVVVTVGDNLGPILEVVLFVNQESACTMTQFPYECTFQTHAANQRPYQLQASARDGAGNVGLSPLVLVVSGDDTREPQEPTAMLQTPARPRPWQKHLSW